MTRPDDTREARGAVGESERRALELLQALRAERAPVQLRTNIERLRSAPRPRARTTSWPGPLPLRRPAWGLRPASGLAAAAVCAAILAALVVTGSGPGASGVLQAATLALRGPVTAAPAPDREAPQMRLDRSVEEIYFPNWGRFGWLASGQRADRFDGRLAVTVYYSWGKHSIAYTILASPALAVPDAPTTRFAGTEFKTLGLGRRMVVTWRRLGHTCVLSGTGVPARDLYALAAWHPAGSDY